MHGQGPGIQKPTVSSRGVNRVANRERVLGRQVNGGIIASGTPIQHPGRIAGGAPEIANPKLHSVFAPIVYMSPLGSTPGGLVDKKQQIDPRMTVFAHPFAGHGYRSINSQIILPAISTWNGFPTHQNDVPLVMPHERGTFFQKKLVPPIKMQFGANQSGRRPDTAFHRHPKTVVPRPLVRSAIPTEKLQREMTFPSFISHNRLIYDPNNSSYGGGGRWGKIKRSASCG